MELAERYKVKCLFAGMQNVGKSSIVNILEGNNYNPDIPATVAIEFATVNLRLEEFPLRDDFDLNNNKKLRKVQEVDCRLWDSAGSTRYFSIVKSYLREIDIAFLVFDMSNRESWKRLTYWKEEIEKYSSPKFVLVGSKSDLRHEITLTEIEERSKEWNIKNYIISNVNRSSKDTIRIMLYRSCVEYHRELKRRICEGEEVPEHVLTTYKQNYVDFDVAPRSKFCCY